MAEYTREDVVRMCNEQDIEYIRLQFTDISGTLKNIAVTVSQLERAQVWKALSAMKNPICIYIRISVPLRYFHGDHSTERLQDFCAISIHRTESPMQAIREMY